MPGTLPVAYVGRVSARIELEEVRKAYPDGTVAVGGLTLTVEPGEVLALVGPSGCGKSTTLRMVNRLVEPTSGRVLLDGVDTATLDPVRLRRGIGYVIQDVGLLPHRTVEANVATVPRLLGWDRARTRARVGEVLELVGLPVGAYGRRYPHQLSGGERQRVGVARALATDPPVLLLDEPFGAVDPEFRRQLQASLEGILADVGSTVVLVTHDLDEAVRLGDRVAVLSKGGHLEQVADPLTVLARPATPRVRDFVGDDAAVRLVAPSGGPSVVVVRGDDGGASGVLDAATAIGALRRAADDAGRPAPGGDGATARG
ncbi:ABC transporter ATP-binding protein [Xylanimonas protaetiae]|uniref:ABC-type quaternary amine transporter n=1 Tax=Xylanimonas protaetiae TaxID=2509457 RepID=A0A4P6F518_9MICO|nr:ATP-binding cassette domain-containing protein [Xylanimonas protaetiae]QAY70446.1 ATP-binding cassette domain-containing protein [Xylanimonas protaetiae]